MELKEALISAMIDQCDERLVTAKTKMDKATHSLSIKNHQLHIKWIKTEKILYRSFINPTTTPAFISTLLERFDEHQGDYLENFKQMVVAGLVQEKEYLQECKMSLTLRDVMKMLSKVGQKS